MANLGYRPIAHDHGAFLDKALKRRGFAQAYAALEDEYILVRELLAARTRAGLTQEEVAKSMGTTKSAVSRLEGTSRHSPSLGTLRKYARAVGCTVDLRLVPATEPRAASEMPSYEDEVAAAEAELDAGQGIPHREVEARLRKFYAEAPEDPPGGEVDWGPPVGREVW